MYFEIGKIFKDKDEFDNKFIVCTVKDYNRDTYLNRRIFLRTILLLPIAFILGYLAYFNATSIELIKKYSLGFLSSFIFFFYICQLPKEVIRVLFYPKVFTNENVKMKFFNRKRLVTAEYTESIDRFRLFFSLFFPPAILITISIILLIELGNNILLYGFLTANLVLSTDDILNILLLLKNTDEPKTMNVIKNSYDIE